MASSLVICYFFKKKISLIDSVLLCVSPNDSWLHPAIRDIDIFPQTFRPNRIDLHCVLRFSSLSYIFFNISHIRSSTIYMEKNSNRGRCSHSENRPYVPFNRSQIKNEASSFLCNRCTHIPKSEQFTFVRCSWILWLYNAICGKLLSLFIFRLCLRLALHNQNTYWRWESEKYRISPATRTRRCTSLATAHTAIATDTMFFYYELIWSAHLTHPHTRAMPTNRVQLVWVCSTTLPNRYTEKVGHFW